jgi:hypothetical protein
VQVYYVFSQLTRICCVLLQTHDCTQRLEQQSDCVEHQLAQHAVLVTCVTCCSESVMLIQRLDARHERCCIRTTAAQNYSDTGVTFITHVKHIVQPTEWYFGCAIASVDLSTL